MSKTSIIPLLVVGTIIYLALKPKKAEAAEITKEESTVPPPQEAHIHTQVVRYTPPTPGVYIAEIIPFRQNKPSVSVNNQIKTLSKADIIKENTTKTKTWRLFYG